MSEIFAVQYERDGPKWLKEGPFEGYQLSINIGPYAIQLNLVRRSQSDSRGEGGGDG